MFTDHRSYYSSHERRVSEEETVQAVQGFEQVKVIEVWRERLRREKLGPSFMVASGLGRVQVHNEVQARVSVDDIGGSGSGTRSGSRARSGSGTRSGSGAG